MSSCASGGLPLKIVILSARCPQIGQPRRKARKQTQASISVTLEDKEGKPLLDSFNNNNPYSYKTETTVMIQEQASWEETCTFEMSGGATTWDHRIAFRLCEGNDELGVSYYAWQSIKIFDKSPPEELKLSPMGSLRVQVGWTTPPPSTQIRAFRMDSLNQAKHPRRSQNLAVLPTIETRSRPSMSNWGRIEVSEQSRTSRRHLLKEKPLSEKDEEKVTKANAQVEAKKIGELEKRVEELGKVLEIKNANIVKTQEMLQEAKESLSKMQVGGKNPEIQSLQNKVELLKCTITAKSSRSLKLESIVKRYQSIDNDARQVLGLAPLLKPDEEDTAATATTGGEAKSLAFGLKKAPKPIDKHKIPDTPEGYASFLSTPDTLDLLGDIKRKLGSVESLWLSRFLSAGGLESILTTLTKIEASPMTDYPVLVKEVQLVGLVKAVLNNPTVLVIVLKQYRDVFSDLSKLALLSKNSLVKSEMCMLLAGLCLYGRTYHRMISDMVRFVAKNPKPYFALIASLREERDRGLMTSCMALINALIDGEIELGARMKMRSLFIDSGIVLTMAKLSKHYQSESALMVQFSCFEKSYARDQDKLKILRYIGNIDLHNPLVLFNKILQFSFTLGAENLVLSTLQYMLLIPEVTSSDEKSGYNPKAKRILNFIERAIRRVAFPEEPQALGQITYEEMHQVVTKRVQQIDDKDSAPVWLRTAVTKEAPTAPQISTKGSNSQPDPDHKNSSSLDVFKDSSVPAPRKEMRHLYWDKIPENNISSSSHFWGSIQPDLAKMEYIFPLLEENFFGTKSSLNARLQSKKSTKIALLPVHIANSISILRAQFGHLTDLEIIHGILDVRNRPFTTAQLEALIKCVPTDDSMIDALLRYDGNIEDLREAERFSLTLLTIDNVGDMLYSLVFYDEFPARSAMVQRQLSAMKEACEEILSNERFQGILTVLLAVSNLLTFGAAQNETKLGKLIQIKLAKNSHYSLGDFITEYIDEQFDDLAIYYDQLKSLEEALRYQPRLIQEEMYDMKQRLEAIFFQVENTPDEFRGGAYANYFELIEKFVDSGTRQISQLETEFETFDQFGKMVLQAFGVVDDENSLQVLLNYLHIFAKKFRDIAWDRRSERQDFGKYKKLGLIGDHLHGSGMLEQLIEGVTRGDYSVVEKAAQLEVDDDFLASLQPPEATAPFPAAADPVETAPALVGEGDSVSPVPSSEALPDHHDFDEPTEPDQPGQVMTVEELLGTEEDGGGPNVEDLEALLAETKNLEGLDEVFDELLT